MSTIDEQTAEQEAYEELVRAATALAAGIRDPEAMRRACERMDRMSQEVFRRNGLLDIGVQAIRELRDEDALP